MICECEWRLLSCSGRNLDFSADSWADDERMQRDCGGLASHDHIVVGQTGFETPIEEMGEGATAAKIRDSLLGAIHNDEAQLTTVS